MKRKNGIIIALSVLLVIVFSAGLLSFFSVGFSNWDYKTWFDRFKVEDSEPATITEDLNFSEGGNIEMINQSGDIQFAWAEVPVPRLNFAAGDPIVTKQVTATIYPSSLADSVYLDWSVYWVTQGDLTGDANTYITVVPVEDGGKVANVNALKHFYGGVIGIKATTRGYQNVEGTCDCIFVGAPTTFTLKHQYNDVGNLVTRQLTEDPNADYYYTFNLTNAFSKLGPDYDNPNYSISVSEEGKFKLKRKNTPKFGGDVTYQDIIIDSSVDSPSDFDLNYLPTYTSWSDFVSFTLDSANNRLKVTAKASVQSIYTIFGNQSTTSEWFYDGPYIDPVTGIEETVYFVCTITDSVSGKTATIKIDCISATVLIDMGEDVEI